MTSVKLDRIEVENLRGYYSASLNLARARTLIVGPNNSGKTSILRLLDWALNVVDESLLNQQRPIADAEEAFLLPARDARHRARRLNLWIRVSDRRSWNKFGCNKDGCALLRFNVRLTPTVAVYAKVGNARRGEKAETDPKAIELIRRLRSTLVFVHIPSSRDALSVRFNTTLRDSLRARIEAKALHAAASGAPKEHRQVALALSRLRTVVLGLAQPVWNEVQHELPTGMTRNARIDMDLDQRALLEFLESRLTLRVSTGDHDALAVPMPELGSGLQSLLDLAFQETSMRTGVQLVVAVEEPEAFLHPSAQRTVARKLLTQTRSDRQVLVTTHSPIVVEEAMYGEVVLCRDHQFFEPAVIPDQIRESINTALLSGFGAEMIYGSAVLFVEGEGDRQFFDRLRRRISMHDPSGAIDRCFVVPVGGKTRFSPWMRLLNCYGTSGNRPVRWLVVADSDASPEVRRAFSDAQMQLRSEVVSALSDITTTRDSAIVNNWRTAVRAANSILRSTDTPLHFLELDLEEASLARASNDTLARIADVASWTDSPNREEVLSRLGSRAYSNGDGKKHVHIRGYIGATLPPSDVSPNVRQCLERWISMVLDETNTRSVLDRWESDG